MEELQKSQTKHVLEVQRKNATQGHATVELGLGKLCFAWLVTSHGSAWLPSEGLLWAHHHLVRSYWDFPVALNRLGTKYKVCLLLIVVGYLENRYEEAIAKPRGI